MNDKFYEYDVCILIGVISPTFILCILKWRIGWRFWLFWLEFGEGPDEQHHREFAVTIRHILRPPRTLHSPINFFFRQWYWKCRVILRIIRSSNWKRRTKSKNGDSFNFQGNLNNSLTFYMPLPHLASKDGPKYEGKKKKKDQENLISQNKSQVWIFDKYNFSFF